MIFDSLQNIQLYRPLNRYFETAFRFLENKENWSLAPGNYEIDGKNIFAIVQEYPTKEIQEGKWEAHQKYIDIQYMVSGPEVMGIAPVENMQVSQPYHTENDYALFEGNGEDIVVPAGHFTIFFPHDVHMPGLKVKQSEIIKKIVIKVAV